MSDITKHLSTLEVCIIIDDVCESLYTVQANFVSSPKLINIPYSKQSINKSAGDHLIKNRPFIVNGIFLHYFLKELRESYTYRKLVINNFKTGHKCKKTVAFIIKPPQREILDYQWAYRTSRMAWERAELDHAMSWLSTLGGAFSALGEEFSYCAKMAGKISFQQLALAMCLGDPLTVSRCKLYMSLSLIQCGRLRLAEKIIREQYRLATSSPVIDNRLISMCYGIWSKLQYHWRFRPKKLKKPQ